MLYTKRGPSAGNGSSLVECGMAVVICSCRACGCRFAPDDAPLDWRALMVPLPLVFGGLYGAWAEQEAGLLAIAVLGLLLMPLMRRLRATPCPDCDSCDIARRVVSYLTVRAGGADYQRRW